MFRHTLPKHLSRRCRPPTPAAAPTFLRCLITAKKVGVKAWGSAAPKLEQCLVQKCGEQGVRAQESAAPVLHA